MVGAARGDYNESICFLRCVTPPRAATWQKTSMAGASYTKRVGSMRGVIWV